MLFTLICGDNFFLFFIVENSVRDESYREKKIAPTSPNRSNIKDAAVSSAFEHFMQRGHPKCQSKSLHCTMCTAKRY